MKRSFALALGIALGLVGASPAAGGRDVTLKADSKRYGPGRHVQITLRNDSGRPVAFESPWVVKNAAGETVAGLNFRRDEQVLRPGQERVWVWDRTPNFCDTDGVCTEVGGRAPPGRYRAVVRTDQGVERARFALGRFFTLGFRSRPHLEFTLFSTKAGAIREMTGEARAKEKTKIVSGIVRWGRKPYNPDWRFTMGPGTIVLGEVFTEVCDGSPRYVQRNRSSWEGERWCPWSSYVKRAGK